MLLRYGASRSDQELYNTFLPQRTPSSIKHKRQQMGLFKRPEYFDRIGETEKPMAPGLIDLAHSPSVADIPRTGLSPEQERAQILLLFLSRLDEFDADTLEKIEEALEMAKRGLVLLHGE